jgi:hypothetical protein
MTKNDNGNGNKVLCKVRKEWQWQRSKALKNFVSLEGKNGNGKGPKP